MLLSCGGLSLWLRLVGFVTDVVWSGGFGFFFWGGGEVPLGIWKKKYIYIFVFLRKGFSHVALAVLELTL